MYGPEYLETGLNTELHGNELPHLQVRQRTVAFPQRLQQSTNRLFPCLPLNDRKPCNLEYNEYRRKWKNRVNSFIEHKKVQNGKKNYCSGHVRFHE